MKYRVIYNKEDGVIGIVNNNKSVTYTAENVIVGTLEEVGQYLRAFGIDTARLDQFENDLIEFGFVPCSISPRQGLIMLSRMGHLHQVEQTVYNIGIITGDEQTGNEAVITWEKATAWERNDATVLFIANLLQWTDEMIDDFFVNANKIV